jgi:regulator of replication initiation timing
VLPDTGVAVLSDLLFYLANEQPPRVRRRKGRPDERLERLSFRDLYRFCYLDQEGMDSDFFKLKSDNYFVAQKSVDVLRYVLGYQTEQVAELESNLKDLREERQALLSGAEALDKALMEAGFDNIVAVDAHVEKLHGEIELARKAALASRQQREPQTHAVDELRGQGRMLAQDLGAMEDALAELDKQIGDIERHLNELQMLGVRFQRTASARTLLAGVNFKSCPRCTQPLMALFRACYAIALHRLCARIGGNRLPSVLIIDTATKNVSSVENPEVINAFYRLVYELAEGELRGIQFIIIDNEFNPVPQDLGLKINVRHMVKGDPENPPLVPYLSGDFT